uniref:RNA-dependent RNA polymerase n=1 Tax=Grapevine-associated mitovirus 1 TaxID=2814301 RepID=A0A8F5MLW7_9VIRU|nr:MAG: RNA-dependent RNA polymerase [Grapevine-associated mitovirus 1]
MQSIYNLTDENGADYFNKFYTQSFNNLMNSSETFAPHLFKCKSHKLNYSGKLSFIFDPEMKIRVIAILDYFSQIYLRKIHNGLLKNLRKFSQDRTFTQNPTTDWNLSLPDSFWSMDLSSATDRFPIYLQKNVIRELIGQKPAQSWETLLTSRSFGTSLDPDRSFKYEVGQPMGAYSSWAAFTLTHHVVVQWCAFLEGVYPFKEYILLGDDIVIHNDKVAKRYKCIMDKRLGVELSEAKTHVSTSLYEFAKRWIDPIKKIEYTGLPIVGIIENIDNPIIVYTILFDYYFIKANYYSYTKDLVSFIRDLYSNLKLRKIVSFKNKGKVRVQGKKNPKTKTLFYTINLKKRFSKQLEIFSFSLKYAFNILSIQDQRRFIYKYVKNLAYQYHENNPISRVFNFGMMKDVTDNYSKIQKLCGKFHTEIVVSEGSDLTLYPLYKSVKNYLINLSEILIEARDKKKLNILELSDQLVVIDFDSIWNRERNKINLLTKVGQSFIKGIDFINRIDIDDEIYYGSATFESTIDFLESEIMVDTVIRNIKFLIRFKLEPKKTEVNPWAAWGA